MAFDAGPLRGVPPQAMVGLVVRQEARRGDAGQSKTGDVLLVLRQRPGGVVAETTATLVATRGLAALVATPVPVLVGTRPALPSTAATPMAIRLVTTVLPVPVVVADTPACPEEEETTVPHAVVARDEETTLVLLGAVVEATPPRLPLRGGVGTGRLAGVAVALPVGQEVVDGLARPGAATVVATIAGRPVGGVGVATTRRRLGQGVAEEGVPRAVGTRVLRRLGPSLAIVGRP